MTTRPATTQNKWVSCLFVNCCSPCPFTQPSPWCSTACTPLSIPPLFLGRIPFAAGGIALTGPVAMILGAISTTMGTGSATLISRALGGEDREKAARVAAQRFMTFWASAVIFSIVGLVFLEQILQTVGSDEQLSPLCPGLSAGHNYGGSHIHRLFHAHILARIKSFARIKNSPASPGNFLLATISKLAYPGSLS